MVEAGFAAAYFATECRTPDSRTHVSAKVSARLVQASAIWSSQTARSACVIRGHGPWSKALRAAVTARSTSSTWASATERKTSSVALSRTSMRERDDGSTHSPPMKKRSGWRICCWTAPMDIVPPVFSSLDSVLPWRIRFYRKESQHFHRAGSRQRRPGRGARLAQRLPRRFRAALRQAVAEREMLQASVHRRAEALDGSRRFEPLEPREEMAEEDLDLDACDVSAHAEVLADAEREMRIGAAIDTERERIGKDLLVAVRRRPEQRHLLARADLFPADLAVLGRGAREMRDRADPAQDLLHGVGQELRMCAQLLPLAAVLAEGEQPPADRVPRGLVARLDRELARGEDLVVTERRSVDRGADQLAHEIVLRVAAALLDQTIEVGMQLPARAPDGLAGRLAGAPVLRIVLADHLVRPAEEQLPVSRRNAEAPGDHRDGERRGDTLDEVALGQGIPGGRPVENLDRDAFDVRDLRPLRPRRESTARDAAHGTVPRGIERDDHLGRRHHRVGAAQDDPVRAREAQRLRRDLDDVGVLRDRPERSVPGRREIRHRRLRPQPCPHLVRIAPPREPCRVDEIERIDAGDHEMLPPVEWYSLRIKDEGTAAARVPSVWGVTDERGHREIPDPRRGVGPGGPAWPAGADALPGSDRGHRLGVRSSHPLPAG